MQITKRCILFDMESHYTNFLHYRNFINKNFSNAHFQNVPIPHLNTHKKLKVLHQHNLHTGVLEFLYILCPQVTFLHPQCGGYKHNIVKSVAKSSQWVRPSTYKPPRNLDSLGPPPENIDYSSMYRSFPEDGFDFTITVFYDELFLRVFHLSPLQFNSQS